MAITYDAVNNIITVTGYTEAVPCTFLDLYNADVAGGWGVITQQGTYQFQVNCRLIVGDGVVNPSWLADTFVEVTVLDTAISVAGQRLIDRRRYGHIRFGTLDNATNKQTSEGCSFLFDNTSNRVSVRFITSEAYPTDADIQLYSCRFIAKSTSNEAIMYRFSGSSACKIYNCYFEKTSLTWCLNVDVSRLTIAEVGTEAGLSYGSGGFTDLLIYRCKYGIYHSGNVAETYSNFTIQNSTTSALYAANITVNKYLINADIDSWTITWIGGAANTASILRQYTFDLVTEPKATVILLNKNHQVVFRVKADSNGVIAQQTVTRGYYQQSTGNELQDYGPHTLIIRKTSYPEYRKQIVIDEKIDWRINLMPEGITYKREDQRAKKVAKVACVLATIKSMKEAS